LEGPWGFLGYFPIGDISSNRWLGLKTFQGQAVTLLGQQDAIAIDEELMSTPGVAHFLVDFLLLGSSLDSIQNSKTCHDAMR